ncbi:MAG TPA: LCP family protein, partial [Acidimicrobiales bacterium]|nr:LCP family protein [Acidimicrobiales bacterium]
MTSRAYRIWPQRLLKGAIVLVTVCVLAAGAGYAYLRHQLAKINRLSIPGLDASGAVMNVLLVGSDSREDVTGDLAETTGKGQVSGQRSDTLMVLHVDPEHSKAAIFSIPRDLYVPISGTDYSDRVNTAFSVAGAPGLIATIEEAMGFPINHYVEIDFTGFRDIVNAVGGVKIYFPSPVRDEVAGLSVDDPGCVKLDGDAGLAFVRSRNFESYESGEWQVDPT